MERMHLVTAAAAPKGKKRTKNSGDGRSWDRVHREKKTGGLTSPLERTRQDVHSTGALSKLIGLART